MWDANQHDSRFLKANPYRPESLKADGFFNSSRLLRVCANLPHLAILAPTIDVKTLRWTNEQVQKYCQDGATGRMKKGSISDQHYEQLVANCP